MLRQLINFLLRLPCFFGILCLPFAAYAAETAPTDLGYVANNILESVFFASDFVQTTCFIVGGGFIFASIIKFFEHKRSPLMVPISTVVFLFVAGVILILLPFLSFMVDHAVSYTLLDNKPS